MSCLRQEKVETSSGATAPFGSSDRNKYDFDFCEEEWQSGSRTLSPIRTNATPAASLVWNKNMDLPKLHTVVHVSLPGASPRKLQLTPAGLGSAPCDLSLRSRLFLAAALTIALLLLIGLGVHLFGCGSVGGRRPLSYMAVLACSPARQVL